MKKIFLITAIWLLFLLIVIWNEPKAQNAPLPCDVDAIITLKTESKKIRLVDETGSEVGSITFNKRERALIDLRVQR